MTGLNGKLAGAAAIAAGATIAVTMAAPSRVTAQAAPPVTFTAHTIEQPIPGGYQVLAVDLNKDGKLDLLALGLSREGDLAWFENPTWERHVISSEFSNMINASTYDLDGDGIPEIALAYGFTTSPETSQGGISILTHGATPNDKWTRKDIDALPTSHRVRWVNVDGAKHVVLVNSTLVGPGSTAPDYRAANSIVYYEPGDWKRQTLWNIESGLQHGILPTTAFSNGKAETMLSAGFSGIFEHKFQAGKWTQTKLTAGDPGPWPKSGTSDIVVGKVGGAQYIGAIEPWHGNEIVVYQKDGSAWGKRQVLDDQITDGHALASGDFAGTGNDAIVAGERQGKRSVYIYWPPSKLGGEWQRQVLDPAMAAAGCVVADLTGDHKADIVCIQGRGASVRWYENMGK
jgi:hypothetical protein